MILHTETAGSGEALLFLHTGLQTSRTDFLQQQNAFNKNYQVVVPDLRGHGKSKASDVSNFFEDSAVDLDETLENLGIELAHIVGASLGALAAIFLAKQFPHRIKSLTISGVSKLKPSNWADLHQEDRDMQAELLKNEEAIAYFTGLHGNGWERFIHMGEEEDWYPFQETKDFSSISAPILVIAGEGNPNESHSAIAYGAEQDNVHTAIIPFASHLVHAEQPDLYSKILEQFLKKV